MTRGLSTRDLKPIQFSLRPARQFDVLKVRSSSSSAASERRAAASELKAKFPSLHFLFTPRLLHNNINNNQTLQLPHPTAAMPPGQSIPMALSYTIAKKVCSQQDLERLACAYLASTSVVNVSLSHLTYCILLTAVVRCRQGCQ